MELTGPKTDLEKGFSPLPGGVVVGGRGVLPRAPVYAHCTGLLRIASDERPFSTFNKTD